MATKRPKEIRWPSAIILIAGIAAVTTAYILATPESALAVAALVGLVLAFMRRVYGFAAVLALSIAIPSASGCTAAEGRVALSALELARKIGCDVLCPAEEP